MGRFGSSRQDSEVACVPLSRGDNCSGGTERLAFHCGCHQDAHSFSEKQWGVGWGASQLGYESGTVRSLKHISFTPAPRGGEGRRWIPAPPLPDEATPASLGDQSQVSPSPRGPGPDANEPWIHYKGSCYRPCPWRSWSLNPGNRGLCQQCAAPAPL